MLQNQSLKDGLSNQDSTLCVTYGTFVSLLHVQKIGIKMVFCLSSSSFLALFIPCDTCTIFEKYMNFWEIFQLSHTLKQALTKTRYMGLVKNIVRGRRKEILQSENLYLQIY